MRLFSTFSLACLPLLACGGDSGHHITTVDGHPVDTAPAIDAPAPCTADTSYPAPTFGSNNSGAANYAPGRLGSGSPHIEVFDGILGSATPPDDLHIELWAMSGGFGTGDIRTGTFQLTGSDTNYATCGLCVEIQTDLMQSGSNSVTNVDTYFATGGTITLTNVGTNGSGTLAGSISNVNFVHVSVGSDGTTTPISDGCTSTIASASFSAPLTAAFAGKDAGHPVLHHRYQ